MNLIYLKTFLTVCELGNFTEAAKHLFVPQPTISNRMKSLEENLGKELFAKGKKGKRIAELTEAGEIFFPYAKQIIDSIDIVKEKINSSSNNTLLKVGSSLPPSHPLLFDYLREIENIAEFASINVIEKESEIISKFADDSLDLAFVCHPVIDRNLECYQINSDEMELIVSVDHPLARWDCVDDWSSLEKNKLIMYTPFNKQLYQTELSKINYHRRLLTNSFEMIRKLVIYDDWISFMPPQVMDKEIERGDLVSIPLSHKLLIDSIKYFLVYHKNEANKKLYHSILKTELSSAKYTHPFTHEEIMH